VNSEKVLVLVYYNVERLCIVYPRVFELQVAHADKNEQLTKSQRAFDLIPTQELVYYCQASACVVPHTSVHVL
jgi:hypothetical protein